MGAYARVICSRDTLWCCKAKKKFIASVAQAVLICGWPGEAFMGDLLRELDHGPAALPGARHKTMNDFLLINFSSFKQCAKPSVAPAW